MQWLKSCCRSRFILVASLTLNVLMIGSLAALVVKRGGLLYVKEKLGVTPHAFAARPFQLAKLAQYHALPAGRGSVVFAGDSHIAGIPFGEMFTPIRNRGIGGDTTAGLLGRLDEITRHTPECIFLEIGANDVARRIPVDETVSNYAEILRRIRRDCPDARVFVLSVPPTSQEVCERSIDRNPQIRELNKRLAALADAEGATFIDLMPVLSRLEGGLKAEFATEDGLHLTTEAQLKLCEVLRPHLPSSLSGLNGPGIARGHATAGENGKPN